MPRPKRHDVKDKGASKTAPKTDTTKTASKSGLPFEATGPVAVVGGEEIPAERFNVEAKRLAKLARGGLPPQMLQSYKKQLLNRIVDEHILDKKVKEKKITVSDEEFKAEYDKFVKRFPSEAEFKAYFGRIGMPIDKLKTDMRKRLAHKKLLVAEYNVKIDDKAIKEFYEKNAARYKQEEQVKASHILIKLDRGADDKAVKAAEKKAKELAKKARAKDADFAKLAKENSQGPSAARGGDLGFFPRRRMVKPFSEVAFKLKKNQISDPVKTQFGYHVIKVVDKKPERVVPIDEVKQQIKDGLEGKELRDKMMKFLGDAKKELKVELKEDNIKVNVKASPKPAFNFHNHGKGGHHGHSHGKGGHTHGKPAPKIQLKAPNLKLKSPTLKLNAPKPGLKVEPKK